ncbi:MAG TPA: phosphoribosyltransferase [Gammaproteobacteria bacterium]|nr:phosphoribosyltransferase [Gammaproteobacteria bacterium]
MVKFLNRQHAGQVLAELLLAYRVKKNIIVLALPRGGVPVAYEVATKLKAPLDVFIVRKLGAPTQPELAIGAIAQGDIIFLDENLIKQLGLTKSTIEAVIAKEKIELVRREKIYRPDKSLLSLKNHTIILVDDGIATGATMYAALQALRLYLPQEIIVAIPVADQATCNKMLVLADQIICSYYPATLESVGQWYEDFNQTSDEEVLKFLKLASQN